MGVFFWLYKGDCVRKKCVLPLTGFLPQNQSTEENTMTTRKNTDIRFLALTAVLGAIAAVLMSFEISIPFMPAFIKMDLSEIPVILAGLMMGFPYGMSAAVLKVLLKFLFAGTTTMFVGEIVNILISFLYLLPMCLVLRRQKTDRNIVIALGGAALFCSTTAVFANYLITFPMYSRLFGMSAEDILTVFKQFNPLVKNTLGMLVFSLIPFNLIKYGTDSVLSYLVYRNAGKKFLR